MKKIVCLLLLSFLLASCEEKFDPNITAGDYYLNVTASGGGYVASLKDVPITIKSENNTVYASYCENGNVVTLNWNTMKKKEFWIFISLALTPGTPKVLHISGYPLYTDNEFILENPSVQYVYNSTTSLGTLEHFSLKRKTQ